MTGLFTRRALCCFEEVPGALLGWFLMPSLQGNVLAELVRELACGGASDAPSLVHVYARSDAVETDPEHVNSAADEAVSEGLQASLASP